MTADLDTKPAVGAAEKQPAARAADDAKAAAPTTAASRLSVKFHLILSLLLCVVALFVSSRTPFGLFGLDKISSWFSSSAPVAYESVCSGNGIAVDSDAPCFCDLGWSGDDCSTSLADLPVAPVHPNSVLYIVEAFGDLVASPTARGPAATSADSALMYAASMYDTLATAMANNSASVTVLYAGHVGPAEKRRFDALVAFYEQRGVELTSLPGVPAVVQSKSSVATTRAYSVFRYLTTPGVNTFAVVQAPVHSGLLYYVLRARSLGLVDFAHTSFVSHFDGLPDSVVQRLEHADPAGAQFGREYGGTEASITESLTAEYMSQKTAEMSDVVVFGSNFMADYVVDQMRWQISGQKRRILPEVPAIMSAADLSTSTESTESTESTDVVELVFVGTPRLSLAGGIDVVASALDTLSTWPIAARHTLMLTFLGVSVDLAGGSGDDSSSSSSMTSEELLEQRSYNWPSNFQWNIVEPASVPDMLNYLTTAGSHPDRSNKLAVVPHVIANVDGNYIVQSLLANGIPCITSQTDAMGDALLMKLNDHGDVVFEANSSKALAGILASRLKSYDSDNAAFTAAAVSSGISAAAEATAAWQTNLYAPLFARSSSSSNNNNVDAVFSQLSAEDLPLVSIIIVHHNRADLVKQAIHSIETQTYPQDKIEVILVDDGSTDTKSTQFINDLAWQWWETKGWKVVREPQRWLGASRNTGVSHARGDYVIFLDDDDVAKPYKVEMMIRAAVNGNADIVTSGHDIFNSVSYPQTTGAASRATGRFIPVGADPAAGMFRNVFGDSSFLAKRSFFVDVGGFSEDFGVGFEDYEFLAKVSLMDQARIYSIPEALTWYRKLSTATISGGSMTDQTELKENQVRMMRPFVAQYPFQETWSQNLLRLAQTFLFARGTVSDNPFEAALLNTTVIISHSSTVYSATSTLLSSSSAVMSSSEAISATSTPMPSSTSSAVHQSSHASSHAATSSVVVPATLSSSAVVESASSASEIVSSTQTDAQATEASQTTAMTADVTATESSSDVATISVDFTPVASSAELTSSDSGTIATSVAATATISAVATPTGTPSTTCAIADQDCTGRCPGDASYGTSTKDICGVCGGDGKSCLDCFGVLYGPAKFDNCFVCDGDNSRCLALATVDPNPVVNRAGTYVVLTGAGFNSSHVVHINGAVMTRVTVQSRSQILVRFPLGEATPFDAFFTAHPSVNLAQFPVYVSMAGGVNTSTVLLTVYRDVSTITSVTPAAIDMTDTNAVLTLRGSGLLSFDTARCWFNYTQQDWLDDFSARVYRPFYASVPAVYINSTAVRCNGVPALLESSQVVVSLSYSGVGPQYSATYSAITFAPFMFVPNVGGDAATTVTFTAPAPKVLETRLDDAGVFTYVRFDAATNGADIAALGATCDVLFVVAPATTTNATQYARLSAGVASHCRFRFTDPYTVGVTVSADFAALFPAEAPAPGKLLLFQSGVLKRAGERFFSYFSGASLPIAPPAKPLAPSVDIAAARNLGACTALLMDVSASTGGGGRYFTYANYSVSVQGAQGSNAGTVLATETALNARLANCSASAVTGDLYHTLASALFAVSGQYTFTVTLGNFMGQRSTAQLTVSVDTTAVIPDINVVGPAQGVSTRESTVRLTALLQFAADPVCLAALGIADAGPVTVQWSLVSPSSAVSFFRQQWVSKSGVTLTLPPYAFDTVGTQLLFQAAVTLQRTRRTYTVQAPLRYQYAPLLATIAGGNRQLWYAQALTLRADIRDATWLNAREMQRHMTEYVLQWTCQLVVTATGVTAPCLDRRNGQPLALGSSTSLTIPAGALFATDGATASQYQFALAVNHTLSGRTAGGSVLYRLTAQSVPDVRLVLSSRDTPASAAAFNLYADVGTTVDRSQLEFVWLMQPRCDGRAFDTLDLTAPGVLASTPGSQVLAFTTAPVPALQPGASYCVEVLARLRSDPTRFGRSAAVFSVRQEPDFGSCRVQGDTTGQALSTEFVFRCGQWSTDPHSGAIWYTFYERRANGKLRQLSSRSKSGTVSLVFGEVGVHTVVAVVSDDAGGRSRNPPEMVVTVTAGGVDAATYAQQSRASFQQSKNPQAGLKACGSASGALSGGSSSSSSFLANVDTTEHIEGSVHLAKRQGSGLSPTASALLAFISDLVDQSVIDYDDVGPMVQSLLGQLVASQPSFDDAQTILSLMATVVQRMDAAGKDSRACFTPTIAQSVLTSLDSLVGVMEAQNATAAQEMRPAIVGSLSACMQRSTVCGGSALQLSAADTQLTVGTVDSSSASQFGIFTVAQLGTSVGAADAECLQYYYGVDANRLVVDASGASDTGVVDTQVYVLEFRNATSNNAGPTPEGEQAPSDHVNTAALTPPALFRLPIGNQSLSTQLGDAAAYQPSCTFFKRLPPTYTTGVWDTTGCTVLNYTATYVTCECSHLTEFAIRVDARPAVVAAPPPGGPTTSADATAGSLPLGAIVGGACGGLLALVAIALLVRRSRSRRQQVIQASKVHVLPDSAAPPVPALAAISTPQSPSQPRAEPTVDGQPQPAQDVTPPAAVATADAVLARRPSAEQMGMDLPPYLMPPSYNEHVLTAESDPSASQPPRRLS